MSRVSWSAFCAATEEHELALKILTHLWFSASVPS
jgi:hypothetical protein